MCFEILRTFPVLFFNHIKANCVMDKYKVAGKFGLPDITVAEMESLASFCEAVLPSVQPPPEELSGEGDNHRNKEALRSFYSTSGSKTPVLRQVHTLFLYIHQMICFFNKMLKFWHFQTKKHKSRTCDIWRFVLICSIS